jgi:hypothetical protein
MAEIVATIDTRRRRHFPGHQLASHTAFLTEHRQIHRVIDLRGALPTNADREREGSSAFVGAISIHDQNS